MNSLWPTARRNYLIQLRAYPMSFFIGNILSCFFVVLGSFLIYKTLFGGQVSDAFVLYSGTGDYMSYVILGELIYIFVVRTFLNVSRSFITEMREGTLESLLVTPFSHMGYLCGNMLEQVITTTGEIAVAFLFILPFGLHLDRINLPAALLCIPVSLIAFFGMSLILGAVMLFLRDTYITQNTLFAIINVLCGTLFPTQFLPEWARHVASAIPVTYAMRLLRGSILLGKDIAVQASDFKVLCIQAIVYCIIGLALIKKAVKTAPEKQFI